MSERNVLLKRRVPSQRRGRDIPTDPFDTSGLLSALLPSAADDYAISSRLPHEHYLPGAMSHSGASLRRRQSESSHRRRRSDHQQAYAYADDPFTTTSSDEHEAQQSYRVGFDVPPSPPMVHSGNRRERRPTEWEIEERLRWRQELEDDALRGGGGERDLPYHHHRRDYSSHEHQPYPPGFIPARPIAITGEGSSSVRYHPAHLHPAPLYDSEDYYSYPHRRDPYDPVVHGGDPRRPYGGDTRYAVDRAYDSDPSSSFDRWREYDEFARSSPLSSSRARTWGPGGRRPPLPPVAGGGEPYARAGGY